VRIKYHSSKRWEAGRPGGREAGKVRKLKAKKVFRFRNYQKVSLLGFDFLAASLPAFKPPGFLAL